MATVKREQFAPEQLSTVERGWNGDNRFSGNIAITTAAAVVSATGFRTETRAWSRRRPGFVDAQHSARDVPRYRGKIRVRRFVGWPLSIFYRANDFTAWLRHRRFVHEERDDYQTNASRKKDVLVAKAAFYPGIRTYRGC
ncbi:hypothetical protein HPB50_004660 [Hyalomma asiaticum]|uniref:Uncharacterized protein n=1 Tax=Hyalomma asiaticum TaxID=266040 RepID=A0ACB7RK42_HYAAI|nr:hypothetical protein HPB50_004660 [Hyalomma asiaticum]